MVQIIAERKQEDRWEEFISRGMEAREDKDNSQWYLGDLALEVQTEYGEDIIGKYAYAISVPKKTLMNYRTVSASFDKEVRKKYRKLSFGHFACLTAVEKPEAWLEKADDEEWSVETMRKEMRKAYPKGKQLDDEEKPPQVYRCPECGLWRLKDVSSFEICRGHYHYKKGKLIYY